MTDHEPTRPDLRALIATWRKRADAYPHPYPEMPATEWLLRQCADDLEAALVASPLVPQVTFATTTVDGDAPAAPGTPFNGISTITSGVGGVFDPSTASPLVHGPVGASGEPAIDALREIESWREQTLGGAIEPGSERDTEHNQAFARGVRMAFYRCAERAATALRAAASVPSPVAQEGTFACPICGTEGIHAHGDEDVFAWLDAQASRFGYRMHDKQWGLRRDYGLANRVEHCIRRLTDPDSVLFSSTQIGRYIIETLREELPFIRERERMAVETFLRDTLPPSPPVADSPTEVQIEMRMAFPLYGRLGVGADVWAELQRREKESAANKSSVYLSLRTFQTVMNALRHCGEKHYINPSAPSAPASPLDEANPQEKA
jgi:hypothetical protein